MALPPISPHDHPEPMTMAWTELEMQWIRNYAQAAVLAEREACAKLIEDSVRVMRLPDSPQYDGDTRPTAKACALGCAAAIRSRGECQVRPQRWAIEFADERDFCRFASLLIGAAYLSGPDALKRFQDGSLLGERTHGKVTASAA